MPSSFYCTSQQTSWSIAVNDGSLSLTTIHTVTGIIGVLVMTYAFLQRWLKESLLISESLAATVAGVVLGPYCLRLINPFQSDGSITSDAAKILSEVGKEGEGAPQG